MRMKLPIVALGALALTVAAPAMAHHAFGGEFDSTRPVLLKGPIVKVEWVNPHTWIHMEVKKPDGGTEVWMIEGGSPNSLIRQGVTKNSIPIGTEVTIEAYAAKDATNKAVGRNFILANGKRLFVGSPGSPDAPPAAPEAPAK